MPTPSQLEATRYHLGGSSIGWALGWAERAPSELWEIRTGRREVEVTDEMWFGSYIEPATRALAERYLRRELLMDDLALESYAETVHHLLHPHWWAVHPDAMDKKRRVLVQLKNHDPRVFNRSYKRPTDGDDNDKIPVAYQMQVLWERGALQTHVLDARYEKWTCYLGAYFGGVNLKLYRIGPNARLLDAMCITGFAWWQAHLDPNGPQSPPDDRFWAQNRDRMQAMKDSEPKRPPRATKAMIAEQPVASLEGLA